VLNRAQLIDAVLGTAVAVTDRTIDVHITALRRKVRVGRPKDRAPDWIQTVRGVGYTFRRPE
jgi:DNA-binding response OmpR family regulator